VRPQNAQNLGNKRRNEDAQSSTLEQRKNYSYRSKLLENMDECVLAAHIFDVHCLTNEEEVEIPQVRLWPFALDPRQWGDYDRGGQIQLAQRLWKEEIDSIFFLPKGSFVKNSLLLFFHLAHLPLGKRGLINHNPPCL
jgi:hypothetical protein